MSAAKDCGTPNDFNALAGIELRNSNCLPMSNSSLHTRVQLSVTSTGFPIVGGTSMKKAVSFSSLLVVALLCGLWASRASAQAVYGSIFGTVTDPQGAAVNGAKVTVTDKNKGTTEQTTTNESGNYSVTHLIPDPYSVKVEAQGFKGAEQQEVTVSADTGARVDLALQLGSASESVEVTSEAPQLKTDRADVATTFNQTYVQ